MKKLLDYQKELLSAPNIEIYLKENSCLPGPRSNLELLYSFVEISKLEQVNIFLKKEYPEQTVNNPDEFVLCCAVAACGKHIVEGSNNLISVIRKYSSDSRWRIRESVAMALQHIGKYNFPILKSIVMDWGTNCYEKRAIIAGLCEPPILNHPEIKLLTLETLVRVTRSIPLYQDKNQAEYQTLVQALCYCWSVAVVASPAEGKVLFEELTKESDKDIRKIVKENIKKNRMLKMDKQWVVQLSGLHTKI